MNDMDYKITKENRINNVHEFNMEWNGFSFPVIYGKRQRGWFVAVPEWKVCAECDEPSNVGYNSTKIARTAIHDSAPMYLAQAIAEHWESVKERED